MQLQPLQALLRPPRGGGCCTLPGSWEVVGSPQPRSQPEQRCHVPEEPALAPHGTRPHQQRNKEKSHPKILQTSSSLQNPAINRPLIGHCNGIQFISTSDGLTFIITRGSTCHELWAIHSLVEINCITSAQHRVLCTAHTDGQQLFASAVRNSLPPILVQNPPLGSHSTAIRPDSFHEPAQEVQDGSSRPAHSLGLHAASPHLQGSAGRAAAGLLASSAVAQNHRPFFKGDYRASWGLDLAIWALCPPEHHLPLAPALLHPTKPSTQVTSEQES